MSNYKIKRISSDIRRCISKILLDFNPDKIKRGSVSILRTEPSADLSICKVYVSIMGDERDSEKIFFALKTSSSFFRKELAFRVKLRKTPEIKFYKSDFLNYKDKIEEILKTIKTRQRSNDG